MNSPKVVVSLGLALIFSVILTACGGSKSTPPPPAGAPTIQTDSLPPGAVNASYGINGMGAILSATGGTGVYTWSISFGSLPPGLTLTSTTGVISGTPTTPGTYSFTAKVTDAASMSSTKDLTIYIEGVVVVSQTCGTSMTPNVCPSDSTGVPYTNSDRISPVQLVATGGTGTYTWTITSGSLPPGLILDPASCTNSSVPCVISGTPTTNGAPASFTIQAADSESPIPAVGTSKFSITIMSVTTTTLAQGSAGVPYGPVQLMASGGVPFNGNRYNWCVLGSGGACDSSQASLPPGLSLSLTGVISGTPTRIGNFPFTVQAADNEKPPVMATANLSITIAAAVTNANLNGNYVFTFSGFNNGTPVLMAGSFVADGQGNITSGVLDYNDGTGEQPDNNPTPQMIVPGTGSVYSIGPNGLSTMTITTNLAVFQFSVATNNLSKGVIQGGSLIQSDPANPQAYGSGAMTINFPLSQGEKFPLCGSNITLGFFGFDNTLITRYAGAGQFHFDPNTCVDVEDGAMDTDDGGSLSSPTFTGAFNQLDDNTSRGIVGLTLAPGGRHFYAFYLVSSSDRKTNRLFWISTEPASQPAALTLWSGLQQANFPTGWDNSRLAGTAVPELNALDASGAVDVTAGLFVGNGVAGNTCQSNTYDPASFNFDQNQGGTSDLQQSSTGTYCIDKTTGRVTLTAFNTGPFAVPPVFYMVTANQAFVVGTDPAVTSGFLEQQTGSPFSASSIFGLYSGGTVTPVLPAVTNAVTSLFADGSQNINGEQDTSSPSGPEQNLPFAYTYSVDSTGRVVVQQNGTTVAIMYVIAGASGSQLSPPKFVVLPVTTDPNPALSIFNATVFNQ